MLFDRAIELLGGKCHTYTCDLTKRADVYSTCERIKREVGSVSILINNAGIVGGKSFLDLDDGNGHFSAYINSKENFYIVTHNPGSKKDTGSAIRPFFSRLDWTWS